MSMSRCACQVVIELIELFLFKSLALSLTEGLGHNGVQRLLFECVSLEHLALLVNMTFAHCQVHESVDATMQRRIFCLSLTLTVRRGYKNTQTLIQTYVTRPYKIMSKFQLETCRIPQTCHKTYVSEKIESVYYYFYEQILMTSHLWVPLFVRRGYKDTHTLHVPVYTIEFDMSMIFSCTCSLILESPNNLFITWQAASFRSWILAFSETCAGCYYVSAVKKPTLGILIPTTCESVHIKCDLLFKTCGYFET